VENRPYKILYVDDQPEMIELVQLALRRLDFEVCGASDGLQALDLMRMSASTWCSWT